jgi:hypothetical protein
MNIPLLFRGLLRLMIPINLNVSSISLQPFVLIVSFLHAHYSSAHDIEHIKLHTLYKRRYNFDGLFYIQVHLVLNPVLLCLKLLVYELLLRILKILLCSLSGLLVKIALLTDEAQMLMLFIRTITYLESELFPWNVYYNGIFLIIKY